MPAKRLLSRANGGRRAATATRLGRGAGETRTRRGEKENEKMKKQRRKAAALFRLAQDFAAGRANRRMASRDHISVTSSTPGAALIAGPMVLSSSSPNKPPSPACGLSPATAMRGAA